MDPVQAAKPVFYSDGSTFVRLGDYVTKRILFRRRTGRVVFVPGISRPHPEMEDDGIQYVGIQIVDGPFVASVIDPSSNRLFKKIVFVRRGPMDVKEIAPNDRLFEDEEGRPI